MAVDLHPLLASSLVAVTPSPATSGLTITVATGDGALFPSAAYNVVATPRGVIPSLNNSEILRLASVSGDVLTFSARAQEGSTAQSIGIGWVVAAVDTSKTFTDIETDVVTRLRGRILTSTGMVDTASLVVTLDEFGAIDDLTIGA